MAKNKDVLLLMPLMAEIGILICFYSIVLPTCVGTTPDLPDSKSLMGLAVLMVGIGELLATFVQVLHSKHFIQVRLLQPPSPLITKFSWDQPSVSWSTPLLLSTWPFQIPALSMQQQLQGSFRPKNIQFWFPPLRLDILTARLKSPWIELLVIFLAKNLLLIIFRFLLQSRVGNGRCIRLGGHFTRWICRSCLSVRNCTYAFCPNYYSASVCTCSAYMPCEAGNGVHCKKNKA